MTFRKSLFIGAAVGFSMSMGAISAQAVCAPNPCAAKSNYSKNPCAANPCAAKNPCATKNPCAANPCAAKNPCAANPCAASNPCAANPCAATMPTELTEEQAAAQWDRLVGGMHAAYGKSAVPAAAQFLNWINVTKAPYQSSTHGDRYLINIVNDKGAAYAKFEQSGKLPAGSILAKPTIVGKKDGTADLGPLFLMEKMPKGWNKATWDWKYSMIMADGTLWGETGGKNSMGMDFCADCHNAAGEETDAMLFLPEEYRR